MQHQPCSPDTSVLSDHSPSFVSCHKHFCKQFSIVTNPKWPILCMHCTDRHSSLIKQFHLMAKFTQELLKKLYTLRNRKNKRTLTTVSSKVQETKNVIKTNNFLTEVVIPQHILQHVLSDTIQVHSILINSTSKMRVLFGGIVLCSQGETLRKTIIIGGHRHAKGL